MKAAVIGSDSSLCLRLKGALEEAGHSVLLLPDPARAFSRLCAEPAHIVLVGGNLPREAALELARTLRGHAATSRAPLVGVALAAPADSWRYLEAGFDDVIAEPFVPRVLAARAEVLLRRRLWAGAPGEPEPEVLRVGALCVRSLERVAFCGERELDLNRLEFELLLALARAGESGLPRAPLAARLFGETGQGRDVERLVGSLRRALGESAALLEETAEGYRLAARPRDRAGR